MICQCGNALYSEIYFISHTEMTETLCCVVCHKTFERNAKVSWGHLSLPAENNDHDCMAYANGQYDQADQDSITLVEVCSKCGATWSQAGRVTWLEEPKDAYGISPLKLGKNHEPRSCVD